MENSTIKKLLPHGIAFVVMVVLALMFFSANVFDGRVLSQNDINQASASQSEMEKVKAATGQAPLWTNAYFSGMPTFQIHLETKGNLTVPVFKILMAGQPITSYFAEVLLAMLCMYLLLTVMRLDWRLSLLGSIVFGISTFNMDIISAGHSTKMVALAYTPAILAGVVAAFRGKYMLGAAMFALFTALQMYANHYQITYYTFLVVAVIGVSELINAVRTSSFLGFGKAALSLIVGLAVAVLTNITTIWTTMEYQAESTRGKTELSAASKAALQAKQGTSASSNPDGGLSKDYAFGWSYGIGETMTLLVQNAYGGGASQNMSNVPIANQGLAGALYMGNQPFVGVAIYFGAIIVFLFFLGIQIVDARWRWSILAASLLAIGIAWGKNSPIATTFYDILPLFNKFRAHTQALGLGQLLFALMAMLALNKFLDPSVSKAQKQRALLIAGGVTVALCAMSFMGSFANPVADQRIIGQIKQSSPQVSDAQINQLMASVREARADLAQSDAMRSLGLVLAAAALLWLLLRGVISKSWVVVAGIGLLCFGDAWTASRRVIYDEKFQDPAKAKEEMKASAVDELILKDKDLSFRVLDLRRGFPFENANTSMFHKSVGGYHAAKMMIYQEMIERHLGNFEQGKAVQEWAVMPLYGMLNAKYIILGDEMNGLLPNPQALGNAWFVKNVKVVDNADQELEEVGKITPRFEAVAQKKHAEAIGLTTPQYDSTATIKMTSYHPDKLEYESSAKSDQVAVFSEIYYPMEKGWSLTIDGQPAKFGKANYILRAAKIPAGNHKIVMEFHPKSYYSGETYSMIASVLLLLSFAGGLFLYFRKNGLPDTDLLPEQLEVEKTERKTTPSVAKPTATPTEKPKPTLRKKK
ncbi:MAG: YfhO family protein [Saprospiraceae bacterium]|nr:YfhO family protein [Saprospiraceae bacterium]